MPAHEISSVVCSHSGRCSNLTCSHKFLHQTMYTDDEYMECTTIGTCIEFPGEGVVCVDDNHVVRKTKLNNSRIGLRL